MTDKPAAIKDRVIIHGLNKAAEFNGREGKIVLYEEDSGRFLVRLDGDNKKISVKPSNLESIPSGSGGGDPELDHEQMRKASQALGSATPEQLRRRAEEFKKLTPEQLKVLRKQQPQFKNMSDEQIRAMGQQMEAISKNPDMMKKVSEQVKNMTPEQMKYQSDLLKTMSPEQLASLEKMQSQMNDPNADQAKLSSDLMKHMSPGQLTDMMKMQKSMLKDNPEMVRKMMAGNPMMKNMTTEQLEKQLDMMADMDPKNLERLMTVTQWLQKNMMPVIKAYTLLNKHSGGRANAIILFVCIMTVYYLVTWMFFGGQAVVPAMVEEPLGGAVDPLDILDDEL